MSDAYFTAEDHYFHANYLTDQRADDDAAEALNLLGLEPGSRLLDAGCGDGRLAVRFAALGYRVTAVDHDAEQLARLVISAERRGVSIDAMCSRLEDFDSPERFDGALLWFTTWGFLSDEHNEHVLDRLRTVLIDDAALVIDTLNPKAVKRYVDVHPEPVVTARGGNRQVDRYSFDSSTSRLNSQRVVEIDGVTRTRFLSLSLPPQERWAELLTQHGFTLTRVSARHGAPFENHSWEMVLSARAVS